jgi:hypothetical protein
MNLQSAFDLTHYNQLKEIKLKDNKENFSYAKEFEIKCKTKL